MLGADTEVVLDGDDLRQAARRRARGEHARAALRAHARGAHRRRAANWHDDVAFALSDVAGDVPRARARDEIARYVATGEPLDKAGGYAIQGRAGAFVARLDGSYSGVMGLPLSETAALLATAGIPCYNGATGTRMARGRSRGTSPGCPRPSRPARWPHEILINVTPQETRVAMLEQGVVQELHVERTSARGLVGNIYLGRVARVLPGMQSAFIEIGLERAAFLHVADIWEHRQNGHGDASARSSASCTRARSCWCR